MITDTEGNILYGAYMHHISHKMHLIMDSKLQPFGITHQQSRIISFVGKLEKKRPVYQYELEEIFRLRRSSITSLLSNLEKKALITRCGDASDARIKRISLTDEGRAIAQETKEVIKGIEEKLVSNLDDKQKQALIEILSIIVDNMEER
jgi:DNA-binding MarR family transcriptional regulator